MSVLKHLHPAQLAGVAELPPDRPLLLLTRHSLRESAAHGVATYDLPLTAEGVALAEAWGERLPFPLHSLHSSPVGRCLDTAAALARGAGRELEIATSTALVEPGCYVHSLGQVGPLFLRLGPLAFANRHLQEPLEGILSPAEGCAKLLAHLHAEQGPPGQLSVHVTHDTILAAFVYHLMGRSALADEDWPWMMEGAWLWFDDEAVHWVWRGTAGARALAACGLEGLAASA